MTVNRGRQFRTDLYTARDMAARICALELTATKTLSRRQWMTVREVFPRVERALPRQARNVKIKYEPADVETVLDVLVIAGLAECELDEMDVRPSRPQRYRWSRFATVESLERFCRPAPAVEACL